jgi:hydroxyethylthiazole kinase-like uncharacterized protein yjeF
MTKKASARPARHRRTAAAAITGAYRTNTVGVEPIEVLTPEEMARADAMAIAGGTPGLRLMEAAGAAVASVVQRLLPRRGVVAILAGPGNNGGDGFVAARLLKAARYRVTLALLGARERLKGDAALAARAWKAPVAEMTPQVIAGADLVVDALFGTGLDRPLDGASAAIVQAVNASGLPVVAVDIPSGIDGGSGAVLGFAIRATETVTFFRLKPGLLLQHGRSHAGRITIADIGIESACLAEIRPTVWRNTPALWTVPRPSPTGHKYDRGHAVVVSGPATRTGAARLAARGALRAGAGLVTVASPRDALAENAAQLTAIMLVPVDGADALAEMLADARKNAVVIGPGLGVGPQTCKLVEAALASSAAVVLDADALTSFADDPERLIASIAGRSGDVVVTPHEGEFARAFGKAGGNGSKVDRARAAAAQWRATVVLKGPDTVVAAADGRVAIADNAPPDLATAGSGDVLAGIIGGLLAQGMPAFAAAAAAVYLHGEAARLVGRGLIAEDLPEALPRVFTALRL